MTWYNATIMKNYRFSVVIEKDNDGYAVFCPQLQGCYAQGDTYEEALVNIKDAIALHIAELLEEKSVIPAAQNVSISMVEVAA